MNHHLQAIQCHGIAWPRYAPRQLLERRRCYRGNPLLVRKTFRQATHLQFQVKPETFGWLVTAPRTRLDIQVGAADLVEELARVYGYDKLPERLLPLELPEPRGNRAISLRWSSMICGAGGVG